MWGEGDPADVLSGRARRSAVLDGLAVRGIDSVTLETLGRDPLIVAQPRAMAPQELVALDAWVRRGGRVLMFADPRLDWPSRYPLGDSRRAPPVTLLDPLLAHWGLALEEGTEGQGRWRGPCAVMDEITVDCRIGRGRAVLIADADALDDRKPAPQRLRPMVEALVADKSLRGDSTNWRWLAGTMIAALLALGLVYWRRKSRT